MLTHPSLLSIIQTLRVIHVNYNMLKQLLRYSLFSYQKEDFVCTFKYYFPSGKRARGVSFFSPPVQVARWAHMHHILTVVCSLSVVCLSVWT